MLRSMLSVIIPTLNCGSDLPAALAMLVPARRAGLIGEVVVADGGSMDGTLAIAADAGCRVVTAARGRGQQLAGGAAAAAGAWLLFLHGDTRLEADWAVAAAAFMASAEGGERAGYFRFALDDGRSAAARRLERLVAWRCRFLALPYGDQGLLLSRDLYQRLGGFRPLTLMEDVDLVRRLGRRRLYPLGPRAFTSARRWQAEGYARRSLRNLACLALHRLGASQTLIQRFYG